ncbi:MAG: hypothetical protein KA514_07370 [Cytophagaceae bacterium]|nr:hypothetical protein [Cytophagaceae bacterium]
MSSLKTKEIVVDVVMEVLVTQRFEVPIDYEFDEYEDKTSYIKLLNEHGSDMLNLTESIDFEDIDAWDVIDVCFQGIADVNVDECVVSEVESL